MPTSRSTQIPPLEGDISTNGHRTISRSLKEIPLPSIPSKPILSSPYLWLVLSFLGYGVFQILWTDYFVDDSYIHLTFARNICEGKGFSFNPTGELTYGVTAPLWTLILAWGGWILGITPKLAKGMSQIMGILTIIAIYRLGLVAGLRSDWAALTALVWGWGGYLARWSASGMETSLALLVVILAFEAHLRDKTLASGLLIGIATHLRPEIFGMGLLFGLDASFRLGWRRGALLVGVFVLSLIPWNTYALIKFHTIMPNPIMIKANPTFSGGEELLMNLLRTVGVLGLGSGGEMLLSIVGLMIIRHKGTDWDSWSRRVFPLLIVWILFPIFTLLIKGVFVQSRYLILSQPAILIGTFLILQRLMSKLTSDLLVYFKWGVIIVLLLWQSVITHFILVPHGERFSYTMNALQGLGEWIDKNTPSEAIVAVGDVGAIGYYGKRKIVDVEGLITREIIPLRRRHSYDEMMEREVYWAVAKPDWVVDKSFEPARLVRINPERYKLEMIKVVPRAMIGESPLPVYYCLYRIVH
ncbi:MAG: hypothetical protein ACK4OO_02860 [bacterium]